MSKINSRNKGVVGEREWAAMLSSAGYEARRGQQFSGSSDSPDVVCKELPFHWEVKRVERLNIDIAMDQAIRDSGDKIPVVAHRKNKKSWLITMQAESFFDLIKNFSNNDPT